MEFAERNSDIKDYLPEYQYDKNPSREWYWNMGKPLAILRDIVYSQYSVRRQV